MSARTLLWVKWFGTVAQVAGVFLMASRLASPMHAYAVMEAGSLAWVAAGWRMRDYPVLSLNAVFSVANILGAYRWMS